MAIALSGSMAFDVITPYAENGVAPVSRVEHGGTAGNIAYNLARLGLRPLPVCAVGEDDFDLYATHCRRWGIDLEWVQRIAGEATAHATIITQESGEQISHFSAGAMKRSMQLPVPTDVDLAVQCSCSSWTMRAHVLQWQKAGTPFYLDPGQAVPDLAPSNYRSLLEGAAGLFLNDGEALLTEHRLGISLEELSRKLKIIRTRGAREVSYYEGGEEAFRVPAIRVANAVDPTGCGDAFRGGYLWGLSHGLDPRECIQAGCANAALAVQSLGGQNHQPDPQLLERAIASAVVA